MRLSNVECRKSIGGMFLSSEQAPVFAPPAEDASTRPSGRDKTHAIRDKDGNERARLTLRSPHSHARESSNPVFVAWYSSLLLLPRLPLRELGSEQTRSAAMGSIRRYAVLVFSVARQIQGMTTVRWYMTT